MRRLYIWAILLCTALSATSQEISQKIFLPHKGLPRPVKLMTNGQLSSGNSQAKTTTVLCGVDTIVYPYLKELAFAAPNDSFFIDAMVGNVRTASQGYILNDTVDILGVQFWGNAYTIGTDPQSQQVMVYLFEVDGQFQPIAAIDSAIVTVTEQAAFYTAMFAAPHTYWSNYAVGVRSLLNDTIAVMTNNAGNVWSQPYNEGLAWRRFGSGAWNSSLSFFGQDLEYMVFPIVRYSITTDFTVTDDSVCLNAPQTFANTSSPIFSNRMYNLHAFDEYFGFAAADSTFTWNYGDSVGISSGTNGSFTYDSAGTMNVELTGNMLGYYTGCSEMRSIAVEVMDSVSIAVQPLDTTILNGDTASFNVVTTGNATVYWEFSTDSGATWTPVTDTGWFDNTMGSMFSILGADSTLDGYWFRSVAVGECGSDTSVAVALSVDIPLSVKLTSFDAQRQGTSVLVKWATANERNSDHFEIARSADGKNFTTIATVKSTGDQYNGKTYQVTDKEPLDGYNIYRLVEYDMNGKAASHGVRSVLMPGKNGGSISIYPNPTAHSFSIATDGPASITITDVTGRVVKRLDVTGTATISTDGMQSGIYLLQVQANGTIHTHKLVIDKN